MRNRYSRLFSLGLLYLMVVEVPVMAGAAAKDHVDANAIVITFKDGHQQTFSLADIQRIEFKSAAAKTSAGDAQSPGRRRFVGKWAVGDGRGNTLYFTFEENGEATNSVGDGGHGTWTYTNGEARVSWDNGWHDAIRKVGTKYKKYAYSPGTSFNDPPNHVADAEKTNPEPM